MFFFACAPGVCRAVLLNDDVMYFHTLITIKQYTLMTVCCLFIFNLSFLLTERSIFNNRLRVIQVFYLRMCLNAQMCEFIFI